ncbi:hypothetical protein ACFQ9J_21100 [Streptomyces sp. NPDC056529]
MFARTNAAFEGGLTVLRAVTRCMWEDDVNPDQFPEPEELVEAYARWSEF